MKFEQWAKNRPLGPKDSHGYMMAKAAWEDSRTDCAKICEKIAAKHQLVETPRASGQKAGALECLKAITK